MADPIYFYVPDEHDRLLKFLFRDYKFGQRLQKGDQDPNLPNRVGEASDGLGWPQVLREIL